MFEFGRVTGKRVADYVAVCGGACMNVVLQMVRQMILQVPDIPGRKDKGYSGK